MISPSPNLVELEFEFGNDVGDVTVSATSQDWIKLPDFTRYILCVNGKYLIALKFPIAPALKLFHVLELFRANTLPAEPLDTYNFPNANSISEYKESTAVGNPAVVTLMKFPSIVPPLANTYPVELAPAIV